MSGRRLFRRWVLMADLLWMGMSMVAAWFLRYHTGWHAQPHAVVQAFMLGLLGCALIWCVLSLAVDVDGSRSGWRLAAIVSQLSLMVASVMAAVLAVGYLLQVYVSRLAFGYFGLSTLVGFILIRVGACKIATTRNHLGLVRRVVIVGNGPVARELTSRFDFHPEVLCKVIGFLAPQEASLEVMQPGGRMSSATNMSTPGVVSLLQNDGVDEVIFAASRQSDRSVAELMDQCVKHGISVSVVPQPYELYLSTPELIDLDGIPVLRLCHSLWGAQQPGWKRAMDMALGVPLLLVSLPIMVVAAVVLVLRKGRGLCREERYGLRGQKFWLYRLNTPRRESNLPLFELVIQHLSITELPQLFNVLRGDMSLVGPRPEGFESVRYYTDWHRQRLNVKPGITGLAQVHGLRAQSLLEDKMRYDLQYILRRSPMQDLSLLLQTVWTLVGRLWRVRSLGGGPAGSMQHSQLSASSSVR
jgi:lipopolysaccharide/colanic/teichoic acid biosynthesis glycosyltransferase